MNKLLLILLLPLCFSCIESSPNVETDTEVIKYYTKNSQKAGIILNSELKNKNAIIITYPEYVSESYSLIKFLTAIMNKGEPTTVYMPGLPNIRPDTPILDSLLKESPLLAFNEFIDLYNFCLDIEVSLTGKLTYSSGKLLILAPEIQFNTVKETVLKLYNEYELINVIMVGTQNTEYLFDVVERLPIGKKVSSAYLKDDKSKVVILLGDVKNYTQITPIALYSVENYLEAPKQFLESNKSIFKTTYINNMNNYLPELIRNSFKIYGEPE